MKELVEQIAKALVDNPEQVSVRPIEGDQTIDGSAFRKSWGRPRVDEETERWVVRKQIEQL
jgi:hypothetical protein